MSLSRIPLPSIGHVLASDRATIPSRPSVITFEFDPLQTIYPSFSGRGGVSDAIHNDTIGIQRDQHEKAPVVEESSFFCVANDSSTVGHSYNGQLDDGSDSRTVFAEKIPTSLSGSNKSKGLTCDGVFLKGNFMALASSLRSLLLHLKHPKSPRNKSAQVATAALDE